MIFRLTIRGEVQSRTGSTQSFWGFGAGLGFVFFVGLDTPKLISKKPKPLRSESSALTVYSFQRSQWAQWPIGLRH